MTRVVAKPLWLIASVILVWLTAVAASAQNARESDALARAMDEMRSGDWQDAERAARRAGQVGRDIIEWHRLREGLGTFDDVRDFLSRNPDWPGLAYLRRRSAGSVPLGSRWEEVLSFYQDQPPQTGSGSVALIFAYIEAGRDADAEAQAVLAWLSQSLSAADEKMLLQRFGETLKDHHEDRLDMLLWQGRSSAAERMYPRVSEGWRALARARLALRDNKNGVDGLIGAIPEDLADDPGLAFERFQWRARKGRNESAIELIINRPDTTEALGEPIRWANWRRVFARTSMRSGQGETAYKLASRHGLVEGSAFADLEWLSGYLALTYLDDPATALRHFRTFRQGVKSPISLGRAGYWEGRALDALGDRDAAQLAYEFGGQFQTSFYGLLAAERAGVPMDPALTGRTDYGDWREADWADSSVLQAGLLLQAAGERSLAERFLAHKAESLDQTGVGQLAEIALGLEEPHIALMIAKRAARGGIVVPSAYYPVVDLGASNDTVPPELALSIARRESEFDPVVVSGAGARGLMQLMPATAREMAGDLELAYNRDRLLSDPAYNATLGTAYLAELVREFGNNSVLISAAYNAGPSRPRRWMAERGDIRNPQTDVVDWIEHIPFRETRNYVMRVMESLPVYRARLSGDVAPIRLSEELKLR